MTFEQLQSLVARCTQPDSPSLYRTLYGMSADLPAREISSWDEWRALPFLSKTQMLETPLRERHFGDRFCTDHLRASSGTSGKPPVFSPRTYLREMSYRTQYHDFSAPMLAFVVPAMPHWHEYFQQSLGKTAQVIAYDPVRPAASVRLARLAGADSISTFAYHLTTIGEHMEKEGMAKRIRFIELCGESCSPGLFDYLRRTFPNATLLPFYGSTEVEDSPIGVPCRPITGEMPLSVYHAKQSQYHELIDPETGKTLEILDGTEGELVISAYPGEPSAFPLIRYRTGDMVRVVETRCSVHGTWSFTVLGRKELDFVKVPGGTLRVDETQRVVRLMAPRIGPEFELHFFEASASAELQVDAAPDEDLDALARDIAALLRINETTTYAQQVAQGRFQPLRCVRRSKDKGAGKAKRLVKH